MDNINRITQGRTEFMKLNINELAGTINTTYENASHALAYPSEFLLGITQSGLIFRDDEGKHVFPHSVTDWEIYMDTCSNEDVSYALGRIVGIKLRGRV